MYLTKEEERILDGEYGEAAATAMRILVTLGEIYGAERLIEIRCAHISGISYANIGDPGREFIERMCREARFKVPTTINPCAFDLERWRELRVPEEIVRGQLAILEAFTRAGALESLTCTPYLGIILPPEGAHIAWAESSAVTFANTVLGARTNREGGPSALAAAIIGKTPLYGLHLDENRGPTVRVVVPKVSGTAEYSLLGYIIGRRLRKGVPLVEGIGRGASVEELKAFCAGLAAASNISMAIIEGVSPDYKRIGEERVERVEIDKRELQEAREETFAVPDEVDLVFFGCPHCSLAELRKVAELVRGRRVRPGVTVWISTSRRTYRIAEREGIIEALERAGIMVVRDTCAVVAPLREMGFRSALTDSAKAAHYMRNLHRMEVGLVSVEEAIAHVLR